ncbi:MAG: hypothetical protein KHZ43_08185 [Eubacterium ventriosum]|nr:hypothetical protein [Eubacterium ventriosum]
MRADVFILNEGETIVMPKDVPHAVFGEEKFKMELVVISSLNNKRNELI